jgi:hypothetical protein
MKHGDKIGMEMTMQGRQKEVKQMIMYIIKSKQMNGSPRISIGNGWKGFKTTDELKVGTIFH